MFREPEGMSIALLVEKSPRVEATKDTLLEAVERVHILFQDAAQIKLISAGESATVPADFGLSRLRLLEAAGTGDFSSSWRLDEGIRRAATELLPKRGKRVILFVSQGDVGKNPYENFSLMELTQYLQNNDIVFATVLLNRGTPHPDLEYLIAHTGGRVASRFSPQGIQGMKRFLFEHVTPTYVLRYLSPSYSEYGRLYIPLAVEVSLQFKNGYDESGYYAPLEF